MPCLIGKTIVKLVVSAKVHIAVPVTVRAALAVFPELLKREKAPAGMVEYTIHNHLYLCCVTGIHKMPEHGIIAQARIHLIIIDGFVTMPLRFKARSDIECRNAQPLHMRDQFLHLRKMPARFTVLLVFPAMLFHTAHPERINMIKYCTLIPRAIFLPVRHRFLPHFFFIVLSNISCIFARTTF